MRFTSFVRLTGRTGWKRRFSAHLPLSSAKLLNWNWIDQRLVTGLATCLASSFEEICCGAEACGHAGVATPRSSAATTTSSHLIVEILSGITDVILISHVRRHFFPSIRRPTCQENVKFSFAMLGVVG